MNLTPPLEAALAAQKLPESYAETINRYLRPLAKRIENKHAHHEGALFLGINGAQGSGKSTLASFLALLLEQEADLRCACLSIDDFYLSHTARQQLAQEVHPLLATRGVPGTHDLKLLNATLQGLRALEDEDCIRIPRFDKATDDRKPESEWDEVCGEIDIIILEGWCVGARAEESGRLMSPVNALEAQEDPDARWRQWVNQQLREHYHPLFDQLDFMVMLKAPGFESVLEWRWLQEQKLIKERKLQGSPLRTMSRPELARFIQHYERITRQCLRDLPQQADYVLYVNAQHQIFQSRYSPAPAVVPLLVVTDLDGTLLDHDTYSYEPALPALRRLQQANVPLILNTSKTLAEVESLQHELGLSHLPCIVENGSAVCFPMRSEIDNHELITLARRPVRLFGQSRGNILSVLHDLRSQQAYKFEGFADWTVRKLISLTGLGAEQATLAMDRHFSEPILWRDREERFQFFVQDLAQHGLICLRGGRFIHVLGQCNKGQSALWLKQFYSTQSGQAIALMALGDGDNDVAMLEIADYPVIIRSPAHPAPQLGRALHEPMVSEALGPAGWNAAVMARLDTLKP